MVPPDRALTTSYRMPIVTIVFIFTGLVAIFNGKFQGTSGLKWPYLGNGKSRARLLLITDSGIRPFRLQCHENHRPWMI